MASGRGFCRGWPIAVSAIDSVVYVSRAYTDNSGTLCAPYGCHTVSLQQLTFAMPSLCH
jgi:hypothetical protein